MPISKENRKRYPGNWKQIRAQILDRANHCCEGSPKYPDCRVANYSKHPITGSKVVLTIAHLDHTPENCAESNLKAWCQRCHNTYDAPHRALSRWCKRLEKLLNELCEVDDFKVVADNTFGLLAESNKVFNIEISFASGYYTDLPLYHDFDNISLSLLFEDIKAWIWKNKK